MKHLDPTHILSRIIEAKRKRLHVSMTRVPEAIVKRMAATTEDAPSFQNALEKGPRVRIIAEIKKASPSKGTLRTDMNIQELSTAYTNGGACAISVVTEEDLFEGDLGWIAKVRQTSRLPVLRKDFIFCPFQLYETRASGASAILFIVAMLEPSELKGLIALAKELNLDALVEVHDETELDEALEAGAAIIGVNNRDLKTFKVDVETSLRLARLIPDDRIFVVESGIRNKDDVNRLIDAGADAFLVGEHFVTSSDPQAAIGSLL